MTVDVEDYFQVSAFENHITREEWASLPCRIEKNIDLILSMFDDHGVKATFFTLGWIAERHTEMVRRIANAGHEIASHGYSHVRINRQDREAFRNDIIRTKHLLEDISGNIVHGYRAASFSINAENHWAHKELDSAGYKYSSSVYPIHHDLYGIPGGYRFAYRPGGGSLLEIPLSTYQWRGHRVPCAGGGYFRLFPYMISRSMINRINRNDNKPCIFYFHPWELDPGQPRPKGLNLKTRFRHYKNLHRMQSKLSLLLAEFNWGALQDIFMDELGLPSPLSGSEQTRMVAG
ncbi:XrtA system polysaccharide deacetylase [Methylohalomonas lacus]|nr:XrtA system polysaccharide deacetylase [Methylohalomonas lacus]